MQGYPSYPNYSNIFSIIDSKLSQNNELLAQEQSRIMSSFSDKLESLETRISDLERNQTFPMSPLKRQETTGEMDDEAEESEDLKAALQKKEFEDEIEVDTYLYLTLVFSLASLHLFLGYLYVIFARPGFDLKQRMSYLLTVLLSPVILLPGLATMVIQLYCVYYVYYEALDTFSDIDQWTNVALKLIIITIFLFMVAKEVSQSIKSFFFAFAKAKNKKAFFYSFCFLPSVIQATMGFIIMYVGFLLIASTDDPINLIQNFASVYVLLEIDNIMMDFIKMSKLSICISSMNSKLERLRSELAVPNVFSKNLMLKLMIDNTNMEIDYSQQSKTFQLVLSITRSIVLILLLLFAVGVYLDEIVFGNTVSIIGPS